MQSTPGLAEVGNKLEWLSFAVGLHLGYENHAEGDVSVSYTALYPVW